MKTVCLILAVVWSCAGFSQGNNCSTAYALTLDEVCRNYSVSTTGHSCDFCPYSGSTGKITYFSFTTDNDPQCVLIDISAESVVTMEMILYDKCDGEEATPEGGLFNHGMCMDEGKGLWAQNLFDNLLPNTTYFIRVRTQNGYVGNLRICGKYYTPQNDICTGATTIGTTPVSDNNACHTPGPEILPDLVCAITLENTAWYTYVVQSNGTSTITLDNIYCNNGNGNNSNGFQIGFFTGSCGSLTPLSCNTGAGGTVTASASGLTAGTRIYVAVDGYSGSNCSYTVSASNAVVLPVRIKEFTGWKSASKNILKWVTVEESDNDYFEIQRSADGQLFNGIGRIAGLQESNHEKQYLFEDNSPLTKSYYRLKQVDIDGKFTYSKMVEISRSGQPFFEFLASYMLHDQLNLTLRSSHKGKAQLSIVDMNGRLLRTTWINVERGLTVAATNLSGIPMGQYYAVVTNERDKYVRSFIKTYSVK